jgi:hypothetical protein
MDGKLWKDYVAQGYLHEGDVALILNNDGFSYWKRSKERSMQPIAFQLLNLPPSLRIRSDFTILGGIAPPVASAKGLNVCMLPIVQEIHNHSRGSSHHQLRVAQGIQEPCWKVLFCSCDEVAEKKLSFMLSHGG